VVHHRQHRQQEDGARKTVVGITGSCCEISLNARASLQASCICMQQAAAMAHDIYVEGII